MPEETTIIETPTQEQNNGVVTIQTTPFGNSWSETPPEPKKEETKAEEKKPDTTMVIEEEEIIEEDEAYKREFGKTKQELKTEYEELKKFRETKPTAEEVKFADDTSKQVYELLREGKRKEVKEYLQTQEQLESLTTGEITKDNAADIIKLKMQLSNKLLTKDDIDFQYRQEYTIPKEPVQKAVEDDDDFKERHDEWRERVQMIEQKRIVAAKMAVPELEKLKSQITLPEISKQPAAANQPTQEELDKQKKWAENFVQTIESNYAKADGFSTKVKDESVELPVSFKIPEEDKVAIKESFKKGFDIGEYIDKRWFDENGNPKAEQMIYDRYVLENLDKVLSGIANNSANERLTEYKKAIKNIDLNGKTHQETFDPEKNGKQVSPFAKEAWSEKMPIRQN
jgi:hypothetical protein